jgi:hypothetical protein
MLSFLRRLTAPVPGEPLFHPPRGPLEVSDRIDSIDLALERDRKGRTSRVVCGALSLGSALSGNVLGELGRGSPDPPVQRVSVWAERDRFEK